MKPIKKNQSFPYAVLFAEFHDIGYGRTRIWEDRSKAETITTQSSLVLHVGLVADGIGGSGAGEAASQIVEDTVFQYLRSATDKDIHMLLEQALLQAHDAIRAAAGVNPVLRSMGTTATLAAIYNGKLFIAHIGDSRAYLVRKTQIIQLTLDHSWGNEMVRLGRFKPEEVAKHPKRDELTRYIGQPQHISLEIDLGYRWFEPDQNNPHPATSELVSSTLALQPGDVILLCTDGLIKERHNSAGHYLEPAEIVEEIQRPHQDGSVLARMLVSRALGRQTDDNVSVVILEIPGGEKLSTPVLRNQLSSAFLKEKHSDGLLSGLNQRNSTLAMIAAILLVAIGVSTALLKPSDQDTQAQIIPRQTQTAPILMLPSMVENEVIGKVLQLVGVIEYRLPGGEKTILNKNEPLSLVPGLYIYSKPGGFMQLGYEPDQSLILGGNSTVEVENLASQDDTGSTANILIIVSGQVLVKGPLWVINAAQREFKAEGQNALFGVIFEPASGNFSLDCLAGECRLGDTSLKAGYKLGYIHGILQSEPQLADYNAWSLLAPGLVPEPTRTPTPTLTSTPTEMPTPLPTQGTINTSIPEATPQKTKNPRKPSDDNPAPGATTESPEPSEEPTKDPGES